MTNTAPVSGSTTRQPVTIPASSAALQRLQLPHRQQLPYQHSVPTSTHPHSSGPSTATNTAFVYNAVTSNTMPMTAAWPMAWHGGAPTAAYFPHPGMATVGQVMGSHPAQAQPTHAHAHHPHQAALFAVPHGHAQPMMYAIGGAGGHYAVANPAQAVAAQAAAGSAGWLIPGGDLVVPFHGGGAQPHAVAPQPPRPPPPSTLQPTALAAWPHTHVVVPASALMPPAGSYSIPSKPTTSAPTTVVTTLAMPTTATSQAMTTVTHGAGGAKAAAGGGAGAGVGAGLPSSSSLPHSTPAVAAVTAVHPLQAMQLGGLGAFRPIAIGRGGTMTIPLTTATGGDGAVACRVCGHRHKPGESFYHCTKCNRDHRAEGRWPCHLCGELAQTTHSIPTYVKVTMHDADPKSAESPQCCSCCYKVWCAPGRLLTHMLFSHARKLISNAIARPFPFPFPPQWLRRHFGGHHRRCVTTPTDRCRARLQRIAAHGVTLEARQAGSGSTGGGSAAQRAFAANVPPSSSTPTSTSTTPTPSTSPRPSPTTTTRGGGAPPPAGGSTARRLVARLGQVGGNGTSTSPLPAPAPGASPHSTTMQTFHRQPGRHTRKPRPVRSATAAAAAAAATTAAASATRRRATSDTSDDDEYSDAEADNDNGSNRPRKRLRRRPPG